MLNNYLSSGHFQIAGPTNSGKTVFTKNLLKCWDIICSDKVRKS